MVSQYMGPLIRKSTIGVDGNVTFGQKEKKKKKPSPLDYPSSWWE